MLQNDALVEQYSFQLHLCTCISIMLIFSSYTNISLFHGPSLYLSKVTSKTDKAAHSYTREDLWRG